MLNKIGKKLGYKDSGFTIIEVMIVLAVAGLIMSIVLVAIPQLQRTQRNSARRDIVGRVKTEIDAYAGNNNGKIPTTAADLTSFTNRYLNGINIEDPQSGVNMTVTIPSTPAAAGAVPAATIGAISYQSGRSCNGEALATGSARSYAMWTQLEGGSIYCLDNL
jgi:prepilin-type N-terminal cleavage/methylation domain-containing protein